MQQKKIIRDYYDDYLKKWKDYERDALELVQMIKWGVKRKREGFDVEISGIQDFLEPREWGHPLIILWVIRSLKEKINWNLSCGPVICIESYEIEEGLSTNKEILFLLRNYWFKELFDEGFLKLEDGKIKGPFFLTYPLIVTTRKLEEDLGWVNFPPSKENSHSPSFKKFGLETKKEHLKKIRSFKNLTLSCALNLTIEKWESIKRFIQTMNTEEINIKTTQELIRETMYECALCYLAKKNCLFCPYGRYILPCVHFWSPVFQFYDYFKDYPEVWEWKIKYLLPCSKYSRLDFKVIDKHSPLIWKDWKKEELEGDPVLIRGISTKGRKIEGSFGMISKGGMILGNLRRGASWGDNLPTRLKKISLEFIDLFISELKEIKSFKIKSLIRKEGLSLSRPVSEIEF